MVDREKVINALQQCVGYEDDDNKYTCIYDGDINPNCPYGGTGEYGVSCMTKMMRDALALLKALDVTPEELEHLKKCRHECKIDCLLKEYERVKQERDALLKAQEPVSVQKKPMEMVGLRTWDWVCGNCGQTVLFSAKFCPWCGKAVKWE